MEIININMPSVIVRCPKCDVEDEVDGLEFFNSLSGAGIIAFCSVSCSACGHDFSINIKE